MNIYNITNRKQVCPNCGYVLTLDRICYRCYYNIWYSIVSNKEDIIIKLKNDIDIIITENIITIQKEHTNLNIDLLKTLNQFNVFNNTAKIISYVPDSKIRNINLKTGEMSTKNQEDATNQINNSSNILPWYKKIWYALKEVMTDLENSTNNNIWKKENN